MIIGFTGFKQSGKDTSAKIVQDMLSDSYSVKRLSLAAPIKEALLRMDPLVSKNKVALSSSLGERKFSDSEYLRLRESACIVIHDVFRRSWEVAQDYCDLLIECIDPQVEGVPLSRLGGDLEVLKEEYPKVRLMLQKMGTEFARENFSEDFWINILDMRIFEEHADIHIITDVRFPNEAEYVHAKGGFLIRVERDLIGQTSNHASEASISSLPADFVVPNNGSFLALEKELSRVVEAVVRPAERVES